VPAKPGDDTVALPLVLHLEHHALVRLVGGVGALRHDAVEAGPLEAPKPVLRRGVVGGRRRDVHRRLDRREHLLQSGAPLRERCFAVAAGSLREQVEEHH
jgi:hypothetical protein